MQTIEQTWTGKNTFTVPGRYFRLLDTVSPVDVVFYLKGQEVGKALQMRAGLAADGLDFDRLDITTGGVESVKFIVSLVPIRYDRMSGDVDVNNMPSLPAKQGAYTHGRGTVLASGVSGLLGANAARRVVFVQNNDASVALRITLDGSNPTAGQGIRIPAGGYWESPSGFAPSGAVRAIAESGAGVATEWGEG